VARKLVQVYVLGFTCRKTTPMSSSAEAGPAAAVELDEDAVVVAVDDARDRKAVHRGAHVGAPSLDDDLAWSQTELPHPVGCALGVAIAEAGVR
jgi:hypothetical protein